eukprot:TRINITY_DN10932_c0_g2_i3.p1 TRINITY_DN10932_c0_g2~~TRINITY_DN10932_c0_g2_i3.p1  ORF type:complete len:190 (-),score=11.41 TRINITY_DN10932_c0_g2_i3:48-617(-)
MILLMFLLVLLAKGWGITISQLTDKKIIFGTMITFVLLYFVLYLWHILTNDPESTQYFFHSVPGIIVIILHLLVGLWFFWSILRTMKVVDIPSKKRFFLLLGIFFCLWFLMLPIFAGIAYALEIWWRQKVAEGLVLTSNALGFLYLSLALSKAEELFSVGSVTLLSTDNDGITESYGTQSVQQSHNDTL